MSGPSSPTRLRTSAPLSICTIAPLRYPISQPHAGGLESALWNEVRTLRARGHRVTFIATDGSDFLDDGPPEFVIPAVDWKGDPRATDITYPPGYLERALPALGRALDLVATRSDEFDVVANHCLHGLPLARAGSLGVPMVSTLHTPVVPELVAAHESSLAPRSRFLSVSAHTASEWAGVGIESTVLPNGVEVDDWPLGDGGDDLVWFGRIVPEKGTHLAIAVARMLGRRLTIIGRIGDAGYARDHVLPHLGDDVRHLGELNRAALAEIVGSSACALVTPVWEEPFGLVVPEALLCGTPVAGFDVGGVRESARGSVGMAVAPVGDTEALAAAAAQLISDAAVRPGLRSEIAASARARFGLDARTNALERVYHDLTVGDRESQVAV